MVAKIFTGKGAERVFDLGCKAGGPPIQLRQCRPAGRTVVALLLAGASIPAGADATASAEGGASSAEAVSQQTNPANPDQREQEIVVTGQLLRETQPEYQLDQQGIQSYGVSTIDDLVGEVEGELGEDQEPLILVNGERVNDLSDIGGYPVEALQQVKVLPRGSAVKLGGSTGQRVISLTLVRHMRAVTLTAAPKIATEGDWHSERGEGLLTFIQNNTRANLALRVRDESSLLESDRNVIQPELLTPYAIGGNIVSYPDVGGEIDPLLSAAAGQTVTVAPVPMGSNPTLADFAADANNPAVTDIGDFRTLRPKLRNFDLNGTASTRLAPWLTADAGFRLDHAISHSLDGLPSALFVLSPANPFSPFSTEVGLADYGPNPLRSRSQNDSAEAKLAFNGRFGRWISNLTFHYTELKTSFTTDEQTTFSTIAIPDSVNPFSTDLLDLIGIASDRSNSRTTNSEAQASATGPSVALPAGPVQTTIEGRLSWYGIHSESNFSSSINRNLHRDQQSIRGAIDVPLTSRDNGFLPQAGDLDATAEYSLAHYSDAGSLTSYGFGLNWDPFSALSLRASIEKTATPASIQLLGNPVIVIPEVRVFDPLTGQTVDVSEIQGGNPSLKPETDRIHRLSALARLDPALNLVLNAEYTETDGRNYISSLPPASLPVMLAFPDRYVRDASGTLVSVDFRPVNFESHQQKMLRWGLSMRAKLIGGTILRKSSGSSKAEPGQGQQTPAGRPATYFQLTANHTMVFSDRLLIRPGLGSVDLLGGGALGIGGGQVRHQIDSTAALTSGGIGARIGVTWRSKSSLDTSIDGLGDTLHFSPLMLINFRLFADARRFVPSSAWAKGLRFTVDVVNATDQRQKVRNSAGMTPIEYQPAYRDPIGRTIELEIRKVF